MMVEEVHKTCRYLISGGIILYPTDTIWGIGCDATNHKAVQTVFRIKQREDRKSMLVLMNEIPMLEHYLEQVPAQALRFLNSTEKPTTIIYPGGKNLAENLLSTDGSVGIRITNDPFCRQLISLFGKPIVSTSANLSGEQSPSLFNEIENRIREQVDYVVNWRQEETGTVAPSSIIKLDDQGKITVLRP